MRMLNTKPAIIVVAVIMVVAVTALFLVVNITPLFIVAYIFTLFGIVLFCVTGLYMKANPKSYPWFAAFPITAWRYLLTQLALSAAIVIPENLVGRSLSMHWFLFLQIVLLAFFAILLTVIKGGKGVIERRDAGVNEKVISLRFMQADVESLARKMPEYGKYLKQVADALRYSDPMSHSSLNVYEEQIQRGIMELDGGENVPAQCTELLRLIADRNGRVKMMK